MKLTKEDLLTNPKGLKIAIHTPTEEEARQLVDWYYDSGYHWGGDGNQHETKWGSYGSQTHYSHNEWLECSGKYQNEGYSKRHGYTFITAKEFFDILNEKPKKTQWKKNPDVYTKESATVSQDKIEINDSKYAIELSYDEAKELKSMLHSAIKCHEKHFKSNK